MIFAEWEVRIEANRANTAAEKKMNTCSQPSHLQTQAASFLLQTSLEESSEESSEESTALSRDTTESVF